MIISLLHTAAAYSISAKDIGLDGGPTTIWGVMATVTKIAMTLIGMLSVLMVVVGGLQIVSAAGNPQRLKQGRETVIYAIVGVIIAISAYAIVSFLASGI